MRLCDLFIRRPILSVVLSLMILLVGGIALFALPVREYPRMESATIMVDTRFAGATQRAMQGFVTTPLAQAIATANGVEYLHSTSTQGRSQIRAKLVLNADHDRAVAEIMAKVQQVRYRLPDGAADPVITKLTDGASAIQYIAFVSDTMPVPMITDFATRVAQPMMTSIPGVASAELSGGQPLAMRIWIDADRLAARGLSAGDIGAALRAGNVQASPGRLKGTETALNVSAGTDLADVDGFRQMVVKSTPTGQVRLGDVATVELGGQNYDSSTMTDGRRSVSIAISPTPDANPLQIVRDVKDLLPRIQSVAPPGLKVVNQFDVAHFVNAAIDEVTLALVAAILIVIFVIFLFLRSPQAVLIPVVTIPLSLIGTAALIYVFGFSLNLLTLLAMVLAIGLVVDDAIVVVENIYRHIEKGVPPRDAAVIGAREIAGPVVAMTFTLAIVFMPVGLMGGLTGALFREFAFTLAASVLVSGVVALTLSPVMSAWLLRASRHSGPAPASTGRMSRLAAAYDRITKNLLDVRPAVLLSVGGVLAGTALFFSSAQRELAPVEDHGYVFVVTKAPQYANLDYTARAAAGIDRIFRRLPEYVSSWFDNGVDGINTGFGGVILTDWGKRSRSAAEVQAQIAAESASVTGAYAAAFQPPPLPASTGGLPVQMVVRSTDDFTVLYGTMEKLKGAAWASGLFAFVDSDLAFDNPEARLSIDRGKAAEIGVSMQAIADTLALFLGENYINRFNWHDRSYDVITQVLPSNRLTPENLGRYQVRSASGELVQLSSVIRVDVRPQPSRLRQFNQMNAATLSGVLAPGVTMGEAIAFLKSQELPAGSSVDWLSNSRQYVAEGDRLTISFALAVIVIFFVLAAQFESWRDPIVIVVTVPLAIFGALLPIYLGFATLNIYTQIGLVTLIGLISKHGILIVSFASDLRRRAALSAREAVREAVRVRLRPVLMTTAAMVAGLLPLLFAAGAGASSRFAIGIVVVMGMVIGTLFTLFVLPTVYVLVAEAGLGFRRRAYRPLPLASGEANA